MDWPLRLLAPPRQSLTSWDQDSMGSALDAAPASASWPAANRALFIPFRVRRPYLVAKLFAYNGTTVAGAGHIDMGIFTADFRALWTNGSVVQSGTSDLRKNSTCDPTRIPERGY